jgi:hypothetical protein
MGEGEGGRQLREPLARRGVDPSTSSGQACGEPVEPSPPPPFDSAQDGLHPLPPRGGEVF